MLVHGSISATEPFRFAQRCHEDMVFVQLLIRARTKDHFFGWVKPEETFGLRTSTRTREKTNAYEKAQA